MTSAAEKFRALFRCNPYSYVVRKSCGAADPSSGKIEAEYATVRGALSDAAIAAHLAGETCLVLKPDLPNGTCTWAMIDHDVYKDPDKLARITEEAHILDLPLHLFPSKSGGLHVAVFFKDPQPMDAARDELHRWASALGDPKAEIFPKVVSAGKMPFGIAMPFFGEREVFEKFSPALHVVSSNGAKATGKKISEGQRNVHLTSVGGALRRRGMAQETIEIALLAENREQCSPPLPENEVLGIARSVARYEPEPGIELPVVTVRIGEKHKAMVEAEEILLPHAEPLGIFQRAGEVTHVIRLEKQLKSRGLDRPQGTLMLEPMNVLTMLKTFERLICFQTVRRNDQDEETATRIDCPGRVASTYLASKGEWRLQVLVGTITAPVLRPDGTVLTRPGFDRATGLFLDSEEEWPEIKHAPTLDDARKALAALEEPFSEFPFVSAADRAVVSAGILTALQRRVLGACPLFAFSAPTQRSGKTLLAESLAIIVMGREAPGTEMSPDKEEFRKSLFAILREAQQIINLDNIEHAVKSATLAKIITGSEHEDRVLGESKTLKLPTNCCFTATGNNLTFRGDMAVRVLLCRIDARVERPEAREFKISDLKKYLTENRVALVTAALTLLKAFHRAGEPKQPVPNFGGFEGWSRRVREPLVWAGTADPCDTREAAIAEDPETESAVEVLTALYEHFRNREFESKHVERDAIQRDGNTRLRDPDLHAALASVAGEGRGYDRHKWEWWLRNWRDRITSGFQLVRVNAPGTRPAKWRVDKSNILKLS